MDTDLSAAGSRHLSADLRVAGIAPVTLPGRPAVESLDASRRAWRRVWSLPDRLVVEFVGIATAEVHDDGRSVVLDRALPPQLERHLLDDHLLPLALARKGELVVHAGLVSRAGRAIVLIGRSGAGKSTLVGHCGRHEWTVGGDDGVALRGGSPWTAEPIYPGLRLTAESRALLDLPRPRGEGLFGKWQVGPQETGPRSQGPLPVAGVLLLEPSPLTGPAQLCMLRGVQAHAVLFQGTFHPDLGDARALESVVDRLAQLAEAVPVGRLGVPRGRAGLASAEHLLRRVLAG